MIEDDVHDAYLIETAIRESDGIELQATRVDSKIDLIAAFEGSYFDFILVDVKIPGFPFEEILRIIDYYDLGLPIVIVSGSINPREVLDLLGTKTTYIYVSKNELWQLGPILKHAIETEEAQFQTIQTLAHALEYRDHSTGAHSNRVVQLTIDTAKEMKVSERKIRDMRTSALLHDVGKIGIPDKILLKPGKLTEEEFAVMQKHTQLGYDLLNKSIILRRFSDISYCHHECWDGSGYPRGLKGEEIPLSARIFTVVDNFDALTSDRPYRKAFSVGFALNYISEQKGKMFDPNVVEAFLKLFPDEKAATN